MDKIEYQEIGRLSLFERESFSLHPGLFFIYLDHGRRAHCSSDLPLLLIRQASRLSGISGRWWWRRRRSGWRGGGRGALARSLIAGCNRPSVHSNVLMGVE